MIPLRWLGVLSLVLWRASLCAQGSVTFANFGTTWAAPWYKLDNHATNCALRDSVTPFGLTSSGNTLLNGTAFTAELWAGPEGSAESLFQRVEGTTTVFRTGANAGLIVVPPAAWVPFAPPQRMQIQLRVWDNINGTVTSWGQVLAKQTPHGTTPSYLSPPLTETPLRLEFPESFVLFPYGEMRVPLITFSLDHCQSYLPRLSTAHLGEDIHLVVAYPNPVTNVQWSFNGLLLPNETNQTLSLGQVQVDHTGTYTAVASTSIGSRMARMTNSMQLTVSPAPRLTQPRLNVPFGFTAHVEGINYRKIRTEFSTDLRSWTPGPTQLVTSFLNTITIPPPFPQSQFYRVRPLP